MLYLACSAAALAPERVSFCKAPCCSWKSQALPLRLHGCLQVQPGLQAVVDAVACSPLLQACVQMQDGLLQCSSSARSILATAEVAGKQLQQLQQLTEAGSASCEQHVLDLLPALHYLQKIQLEQTVAQLHTAICVAPQQSAACEQLATALLLHPRPGVRHAFLGNLTQPGGSHLLQCDSVQHTLLLHSLAEADPELASLAAVALSAAVADAPGQGCSLLSLLPLLLCHQQQPVSSQLQPCVQQLLQELQQLVQQPPCWTHATHAARLLYCSIPSVQQLAATVLEHMLSLQPGSLVDRPMMAADAPPARAPQGMCVPPYTSLH